MIVIASKCTQMVDGFRLSVDMDTYGVLKRQRPLAIATNRMLLGYDLGGMHCLYVSSYQCTPTSSSDLA